MNEQELLIRYQDYQQPQYYEQLMALQLPIGQRCRLEVQGEHGPALLSADWRQIAFNLVLWSPLLRYQLRPRVQDFTRFSADEGITSSSLVVIYDHNYKLLLQERPDLSVGELALAIFDNIDELYRFIVKHGNEYMPSIDEIGLLQMRENHPDIKELMEPPPQQVTGKLANQLLNRRKARLLDKLTEGTIHTNCLQPFMRASVLKATSIAHLMQSYGTRSDIDNSIKRHVVYNSTFTGLQSAADYAIETLASKKSAYVHTGAIADADYGSRTLRLAMQPVTKIYPGSCGAEPTLVPHIIGKEVRKNYYGCEIVDQGQRIVLTKENIGAYLDQEVLLVTPFGCRCPDGICEHCAGYGQGKLSKFFPEGINIGFFSSIELSEKEEQSIISTKHQIATTAVSYQLTDAAAEFLQANDNGIFFREPLMTTDKPWVLRINLDQLSSWDDLRLGKLPVAKNFSSVGYLQLVPPTPEGQEEQPIKLNICGARNPTIPFFSADMLRYFKLKYPYLELHQGTVDVPLDQWNWELPLLNYVVMDDDMVSYANRINGFLKTELSNYTDLQEALQLVTQLIYAKLSVKIFYLLTILRGLLATDQHGHVIPVTDIHQAHFVKLNDAIANTSLTMKLSYQGIPDLLNNPLTMLQPRAAGLYAPFYGLPQD